MTLLLLAFALLSLPAWAASPLPQLGAEARITVSGLSSGGYMAVQVHVAHSARVAGAGVIAGGPYYCAQGSLQTAFFNCMKPNVLAPLPSIAALRKETDRRASEGAIDATSHLERSPVWLFTGANDRTVLPQVVEGLHDFYAAYGAALMLVRNKAAGHAMPTDHAGHGDCNATGPPFINDCDFDAASALLAHLLGPLAAPSEKTGGRLDAFDQTPFGGLGLDKEGFVYIPGSCEKEACRIHVAFHGCRQGRAAVQDRFAREAGYNRWAGTNRLIVLYPQAVPSERNPYNPNGCWDWWGYSGAGYHTKAGAQIRAVMAMVERLSAPRR